MHLIERFLKYISFDTQSDYNTGLNPSTPGQAIFAQELARELEEIGLSDVEVDENSYVTATLPSNREKEGSVVGFIAHMDTSPDYPGKKIRPKVVESYRGEDIVLNKDHNIKLRVDEFPELKKYIGDDLITTSGDTLLGSDDKAGIAEIVSAMEFFIENPTVEHCKVRICFTPDEEIGQGADHFDVEKFGADYAYTIDGGEIGQLEYENFNAATAKIVIHGCCVHPGYARKKMRNSMRIANQFVAMLPRHETPEHSDGYEGFYHLCSFNGNVERTEIKFLIRDFKRERFEDRKKEIEHLVKKINSEFGAGTMELSLVDEYFNMREKIEPVYHIVDLAEEAMNDVGVEPLIRPVRGGTDGARLSYMGLPTPNIFTGGHNFHGPYEFISVQSMYKSVEVIKQIAQNAI
ncbi:peptidase T [Marinilabiliaceae bacterium ANBcel2]|nr:peptidase T [Marinilabiliaceae bacterium ANBcel2]